MLHSPASRSQLFLSKMHDEVRSFLARYSPCLDNRERLMSLQPLLVTCGGLTGQTGRLAGWAGLAGSCATQLADQASENLQALRQIWGSGFCVILQRAVHVASVYGRD